jgi:hypothetical protein
MSVITQSVAPGMQLQRVGGRAMKATIGAQRGPSARSLAQLKAQIHDELIAAGRSDARLAAMIILAAPERIGDEPVGEFLMRIHCIDRDRVARWCQEADVHPWRPGNLLADEQRSRLVRILSAFSKGDR